MSVFYFIIYLEAEQAFYSANVLIYSHYSRTRGRQWYLRYVPVEPIYSFSTCVNSSDIKSIKNYTQRQQYWYFRASAILVHSIVSLWLGQDSPRSIKRLSWGKLVFQAGSITAARDTLNISIFTFAQLKITIRLSRFDIWQSYVMWTSARRRCVVL